MLLAVTCAASSCRRKLTGRRADARYCEPACRQRAYGQRLTVTRRRDGSWAERYTLPEHVASVRRVLGRIDLDPASTPQANEVVRARRFFTRDDDGLAHPWRGRVYLNPPYNGLQAPFLLKLLDHYEAGEVRAAILLVPFTDRADLMPVWSAAGGMCFTFKRVRFWTPDGRVGGTGRTASVFAYLGPDADGFSTEFERWGIVR